MKTIHLQEQKSLPHSLSKAELELLLGAERQSGARLLSVMATSAEDTYLIRAGSVVGTLAWPDLQVIIKPKVNLPNLFYLLGYGIQLAEWRETVFPFESDRQLLPAVAAVFELELRRCLRYGLARGYVGREESLQMPRGRIAISRQIRRWQDRPSPIECDFQEFSEDIPLNRILKAALRRCSSMALSDVGLARRLRQIFGAFSDVADLEFGRMGTPEIHVTRLIARWEVCLRLAQLILGGESLRDDLGIVRGTAFLIDMNKLFERFIEAVVSAAAKKAGLICTAQAEVRLTPEVGMKPDLVLRSKGRSVAVGDAKYIELDPEGWPNANLYQMLAYCVALQLPRGLLIYANDQPLKRHRVLGQEIDLETIGIDMTLPVRELELRANRAAQRLVEHAMVLRQETRTDPERAIA